MKALVPGAILFALIAGCSSGGAKAPSEAQVEASLRAPVDCSTAAADIQTLNSEKARTAQEIEDGASSIIPVGAVVHLFGGDEKQDFEIGTGEYNDRLDEKIQQIKTQCKLQ